MYLEIGVFMLSGLFSLEYFVKISLFGNSIRTGSPQLVGELIYEHLLDTYALNVALPAWWLCLSFVYTDNKHVIKYPIGLSCFWFFRSVSVDWTYWFCTALSLVFTVCCTASGALEEWAAEYPHIFLMVLLTLCWWTKRGTIWVLEKSRSKLTSGRNFLELAAPENSSVQFLWSLTEIDVVWAIRKSMQKIRWFLHRCEGCYLPSGH